jgi:hypothetical protein
LARKVCFQLAIIYDELQRLSFMFQINAKLRICKSWKMPKWGFF